MDLHRWTRQERHRLSELWGRAAGFQPISVPYKLASAMGRPLP
jgi:hypothetical protein